MKMLISLKSFPKDSKYLEYFVLFLILFSAFLLRVYKVDNPVADWHSWRQADTASVTRTYFSDGVDLLYPRYHDISTVQTGVFNPKGYRFVEFPIFNAIHTFLVDSFPFFNLEVWGRLVSVISSVVTALFIFLIGKRLMGKWGGILSCFFFAFIPYNVYFGRTILPEPLSTMFAVVSIWLFMEFVDSERFVLLYASGLALALGILVKPFVIFYLIPVIYLASRKYGIREILKNASLLIPFLIFVDISLVPFFLWRAWMNQYPEGIPFFWWAFNGDNIRFRPSFWRWIFGERLGHLILGGWGLIPFAFGILNKGRTYFIHFFLLGMFLYVSVIASANVRHDYYQIFIIPAVSLSLAQGSLLLWESTFFVKIISRGILAFSIGVMFITGALQVREFYKINHPEIVLAGKAVDRLVDKNALVIAPYNGDTAFLYQTARWGWPYVDRPIDELIEKGANFYVSVNFDAQTKEFMEKFKTIEETPQYVILDLAQRQD